MALEREAYNACLTKILALTRKEAREVLEEAGGIDALSFPNSAAEIHLNLPVAARDKILPYIDTCKAAAMSCAPVEQLVICSPNSRPLKISTADVDQALIEKQLIENQQRTRAKAAKDYYLQLLARNQVVMQQVKTICCISDRLTTHLDCNFDKPRYPFDRSEVLGLTADECMPHLASLAHGAIDEAFRYPERPVFTEFAGEAIPGYLVRYRARTVCYGEEAISTIEAIDPYPWFA